MAWRPPTLAALTALALLTPLGAGTGLVEPAPDLLPVAPEAGATTSLADLGPSAWPLAALPPGADPCLDPASNPLCADPGIAGAGCHAVGLVTRGLITTTIASSDAQVTAPAGPAHDEAHLLDPPALLGVDMEVVNSGCDVDAASLPYACGEADVTELTVNLLVFGQPLDVHADVLRERGCSFIPASGSNNANVVGLRVSLGGTDIGVPVGVGPNTVVDLLGFGFIVINEQAAHAADDCRWDAGNALRIVLLDPLAEVIVSWVSTAACKLVPDIATTSQPTGTEVLPGVQARDLAAVTGQGPTPTGSVTFHLCDPDEVDLNGGDCTLGGSQVGPAMALFGGQALSAKTAPLVAEGWHCWRAEYTGDAVYVAGRHTNDDSECFKVEKLTPTISTTSDPTGPTWPTVEAHDHAVVGGAGPVPTGTVDFYLCNPAQVGANGGDCAAGGAFVGTSALVGGGATSPATAATAQQGSYCWRAEYSGDANYQPAVHTNSDSECFRAVKQTLALSTTSDPTGGPFAPGIAAQDVAVLSPPAGPPVPTGTVDFWACKPAQVSANGGDCSAGGSFVGSGVVAANSATSPAYLATETEGTYCWRAAYSGDAVYLGVSHTNKDTECFRVERLTPTIATTSDPTMSANEPHAFPGVAATDTASVGGAGATPTGSVDFYLCKPVTVTQNGGDCNSGGSFVGTVALDGAGVAVSPANAATAAEGKYCWRAEYGGDAAYKAASHTNADSECFHVSKRTPTVSTTSDPTSQGGDTVTPGTAAKDVASVGAVDGGPTPTGSVRFYHCKPAEVANNGGDCGAGGTLVGTVALDGAGKATSPATADTGDVGAHCWRAEYLGDASYHATSHTNSDSECFEVAKLTAGLSTQVSESFVGIGQQLHDAATVTGIANEPNPTGTVRFYLCKPAEVANNGGDCSAGGSFVSTNGLDANAKTKSDTVTSDFPEGKWCFRAEYSGDALYDAVTHTNSDTECYQVILPQ